MEKHEKEKKKLGLSTRIFIALLTGAVCGVLIHYYMPEGYFRDTILINGILYVLGNGFIRLMQMLVVPLVFCSLVCGAMAIGDTKTLGTVGVKTILFYLCTTALAICVALGIASLINPGVGLNIALPEDATEVATTQVDFAETLLNIIPKNIFTSLSAGDMLPIIFFALFVGILLAAMGNRVSTVANFFSQFNDIMMEMTMMIMSLAPIGVFCLMITSSWCKERVSITVEKREKFNYFEALKHIIKNRALLGLIFSSLAGMIARTEYLFI